MGFNIQEYELASKKDNYNEFLGIGSGKVKAALGIGDGKALGIVINKDKNAEWSANKYITSGQSEIDKKNAINKQPSNELKDDTKGGTPDAPKSNTGMYIGIGVGILAIGIVAIILIRRK
jgi:hypothetical protein